MAIESKSFDDYLASLDSYSQKIILEIKDRVTSTISDLQVTTSYGVAAFKMGSRIFMFGSGKNHIGIYPGPRTIEKFKSKFGEHDFSKGAVKFPKDKPIPFELIIDMAKFVFKK